MLNCSVVMRGIPINTVPAAVSVPVEPAVAKLPASSKNSGGSFTVKSMVLVYIKAATERVWIYLSTCGSRITRRSYKIST